MDLWKPVSVQLGPTLWQFHRIIFLAVYMYDEHLPLGFSIGRFSHVLVLLFY